MEKNLKSIPQLYKLASFPMTYLTDFLDYLNDKDVEATDSLAELYLSIYEDNKSRWSCPLNVEENIIEWFNEYECWAMNQDLGYKNPYGLMKEVIDNYGGDVFDKCNPIQIQLVCERHYLQNEIVEDIRSEGLEREVKELLQKRIEPLVKGYKRYSVSKMLEKTLIHHLSPQVLDFYALPA